MKKESLNINHAGLAVGAFLASVHLIWSVCVALMPKTMQAFMDWIFVLHTLTPIMTIIQFNLLNAVLLVLVTFVIGYGYGAIFAYAWNYFHK